MNVVGLKLLSAFVLSSAMAAGLATGAIAIKPAEHSSPNVEDRHAAEADEHTVIEANTRDVALANVLSPNSYAWNNAPRTTIPLAAQSLVAPVGGGSTRSIEVRSLRTNQGIAFRLEWDDATQDNGRKDSKFKDACAIEFPVDSSGDTRLAMGHSGGPVDILYWSADTSTIRRGSAVQAEELVAAGIYNRARKEPKFQQLQCESTWRNHKWAVVIYKPFNNADQASPKFAQGSDISMAIAVWNGAAGERLGMKSLSNWNTLRLK